MSNGETSKLKLACQLLDEVMPILEKRQVILLFDSWYAKRELLAHALSYPNLNVICNARHDTAMFELPDSTAGRRGRPPKYGKRLMLDEIANMIELDLNAIDAIAVAGGPGSFTGLRIGSATAKGLGLALDKPIIHVPTVDGLAYNLWGHQNLVCPLMDARRNQVYTGIYEFCDGKLQILENQMAVSVTEIAEDALYFPREASSVSTLVNC